MVWEGFATVVKVIQSGGGGGCKALSFGGVAGCLLSLSKFLNSLGVEKGS